MSDEPKTQDQMSAVPQWAADLIVSVRGGFESVNARLDGLEGTDKTLADQVSRMSIAVDDLRSADRRHDDDIRRLSERTKDTSQTASSADLAQEAKLAEVIVWRSKVDEKLGATATKEDLAKVTASQTAAIMAGFDTVRKSPLIKMAVTAIIAALSTWLATKGVALK